MRLIIVIFATAFVSLTAQANSYVEMITKAPEGYVSESGVADCALCAGRAVQKPFTWYDSRIKTKSPVVTSPYPKYAAWVRSMENENLVENTREELQHLIYMVEGGLLGLGLYEIYFRR